jgi:hypothetical protein
MPSAPADLQALSIQDRLSIYLMWEDTSDMETSFIVERSDESETGPWQEIAVLPANATTYTDDGLSDGVTYYYRVKARGTSGDSPYSNVDGDTATALPMPTPTPTPDLSELDGGVVAAFDVVGTVFHAFVTNPDTIDALYRLQRGESTATIPNGTLRPGPGPGMHNLPWSWHLDPDDTHMADFTIELCDGTPAFVEENLEYWLGTVGQYCPWNAELLSIEDYR